MEAPSEAIDATNILPKHVGLENVFFANYQRLVKLIDRVIRDPARAEELAVEAILRLPSGLDREVQPAWLYRAAVRLGLDDLRRKKRGEVLSGFFRTHQRVSTPEDLHGEKEEQRLVRDVLAAIPCRSAEMLLLRNEGLSYSELAAALKINPTSVGTLLARAQESFRREYTKRHGTKR